MSDVIACSNNTTVLRPAQRHQTSQHHLVAEPLLPVIAAVLNISQPALLDGDWVPSIHVQQTNSVPRRQDVKQSEARCDLMNFYDLTWTMTIYPDKVFIETVPSHLISGALEVHTSQVTEGRLPEWAMSWVVWYNMRLQGSISFKIRMFAQLLKSIVTMHVSCKFQSGVLESSKHVHPLCRNIQRK